MGSKILDRAVRLGHREETGRTTALSSLVHFRGGTGSWYSPGLRVAEQPYFR